MATRQAIRTAFYNELEVAATTLDSTDIRQENPDSVEDLPRVVHTDDYRKRPLNNGQGPAYAKTDKQGRVTALVYSKPMEAVFTVVVLAADESVKETVYEDVRSHFERFETPAADSQDIHEDCDKVVVGDSTSLDMEDRDPPARGDSLRVTLGYERFVTRSVDAVETVEQAIEQLSYTTS